MTRVNKLETRFHARKRGFLKKLYELKTLCGIDACAIIISDVDASSDRPPSVQTWPEDRAEVRRLALQYKSKLLSGRGPKKNPQNRKPLTKSLSAWRHRIARLGLASPQQLYHLGAAVDSSIQEIDRRRQDILRGKKDRPRLEVLPAAPPPPPPETQHSGDLFFGGAHDVRVDRNFALMPPPTVAETSLTGDLLCLGDLDANGDVRYLLPPPPNRTDHDSMCLGDLDGVLFPPAETNLTDDSMCLGHLDAFYRNMGASSGNLDAHSSVLYLPPEKKIPTDDSLCLGDFDAFWGNFGASSGYGGSVSGDLGVFSGDLASSSGYLGAFSGHSDDFSGARDADGWVLPSGQPPPLAVETDLASNSVSSAAVAAAAAHNESPKPPTPTSNIKHLSSNPWIRDLKTGSEIQMIATPMWRAPNLSCT